MITSGGQEGKGICPKKQRKRGKSLFGKKKAELTRVSECKLPDTGDFDYKFNAQRTAKSRQLRGEAVPNRVETAVPGEWGEEM